MRAVNLIPNDARRGGGAGRAGRSGGLVYVLLGGLAALVAMTGLWTLAGRDASNARSELSQLEQRTQEAQRRAAPLAPYQALAQTGLQRIATVKAVADARFDWSQTLGAMARILPGTVRLGSLVGTVAPSGTAAAAAPAAPPAASATASAATTTTPAAASGATTTPAPATAAPPAPVPAPAITLSGCAPTLAAVAKLVPRMRLVPGVTGVALGPATVPSRASATPPATDGECPGASFQLSLNFAAPTAAGPQTAAAPVAPAPEASK